MAEQQVDGGSAEGTATGANGSASDNQSDKQPSFDAAKLQSSIDALIGKVDELDARTNGLQSVKDKTTKEISGLKDQIAEYEKLKEKLGPDGALDQMELRQTLADIKNQLSGSVSTPTPGNGQGGAVNATQAFAEMELDFKDPRVQTALTKSYSNQDEAELAAFKLRKQIQTSPSPSPAQGASLQGKPPAAENVEAMTAKYKTDMLAARGKESQLTKIREQAIKDGVPVWTIDFS